MFAAPSCNICAIAAASLHVSKKSCHSALQKQLQPLKATSKVFRDLHEKTAKAFAKAVFLRPCLAGVLGRGINCA
jgi:hypothetical protein